MDYTQILENARAWGEQKHPSASRYRHAAFANSVAYLVTGASGGYGGPSIREHCVSWALAGDGYNESVETNLGELTMQFPDGRLPRAGEWQFEQSCQFAEPICYGPLPAMAAKVAEQEHCFDDDPEDLKALSIATLDPEDLKALSIATLPVEDPETCWAFYQHSRSVYAQAAPLEQGCLDEVNLGLFYSDGSTSGEFAMRWYELNGSSSPRLEADSWMVLNLVAPILMPKLLELGEDFTPEQFCNLLLELGFQDQTST